MSEIFEMDVPCPYCGRPNQAHSRAAGEGAPSDGGVGICYGCGQPAIFEVGIYGMALRKPTSEESAELAADADLQDLLSAWRENVKGKPRVLRADPTELVNIGRRRRA